MTKLSVIDTFLNSFAPYSLMKLCEWLLEGYKNVKIFPNALSLFQTDWYSVVTGVHSQYTVSYVSVWRGANLSRNKKNYLGIGEIILDLWFQVGFPATFFFLVSSKDFKMFKSLFFVLKIDLKNLFVDVKFKE